MRQATWFERVVAILGVALIGLLWAPWYTLTYAGWTTYAPGPGKGFVNVDTLSGWDSGTVTSILVAAVGALCIAQLVALWSSRSPATGLAWNVGVTWASLILTVWLLVRVIWPPDDALRDWGVWTSLIASGGILVTSWLGMQDERTAKAPARDVPIRPIPPPPAAEA